MVPTEGKIYYLHNFFETLLVMAYIGSSLSTTLLLLIYSGSLIELLNREMIIVELLQIMVGSFGLLLTIPLTSLICSLIYCKIKKV